MSSHLDDLQNNDLAEEIEAINAIYETETVTITKTPTTDSSTTTSSPPSTKDATTVKLQIPNHPHLSFLLSFEASYPDTPPKILGTASTASRGEGKIAVDVLEDILRRNHQPGAVCLFDVINEAVETFEELSIGGTTAKNDHENISTTATGTKHEEDGDATKSAGLTAEDIASLSLRDTFGLDSPPDWILSDVITEKKSVFVGRAAHVTSLAQAQAFLDYLLAVDKKVAAATHNISAWRIKEKKMVPNGGATRGGSSGGEPTEMIVQDCDDDGETAAGGRLLHLMQMMDVWNVLVVVTRWYGGVLLGPDRFRLINAAGKDALIKGGFVKDSSMGGSEKGKKKGKK